MRSRREFKAFRYRGVIPRRQSHIRIGFEVLEEDCSYLAGFNEELHFIDYVFWEGLARLRNTVDHQNTFIFFWFVFTVFWIAEVNNIPRLEIAEYL